MRFEIGRVNRELFWSQVERGEGCWLWTGFLDQKGYGRFSVPRGRAGAISEGCHRISWALANGPIPAGGHILHSCDNLACVSPAHLTCGTHAENMADMARRGRARGRGKPGEGAGASKLKWPQVREIRALWASQPRPSQREIAARFGIDRATVSYITRGKTWRDPDSTAARDVAGDNPVTVAP